MSRDRQLGQNSFPSFETWKASLDKAWETRGLPGYVPSLSKFERHYVPGTTTFIDRIVYVIDHISWRAKQLPEDSPERILQRYRAKRAASDIPQRVQ